MPTAARLSRVHPKPAPATRISTTAHIRIVLLDKTAAHSATSSKLSCPNSNQGTIRRASDASVSTVALLHRGRQCTKEFQDQLIGLSRTLLLGPMASAGNQRLLLQVRHVSFERVESAARHHDHAVLIAGREQSGLLDLRAIEKRRQLPITIK